MKERITIYMPPPLKKQIEERAEERGQTFSMWVERACRSALMARPEEKAQEV